MTFYNLNLHNDILKAIEDAGYTKPTEIQLQAIPKIQEGCDIRASAQTGTGKTAAFILPALDSLTKPSKKEGKGPRVLILAPTRELAMQISAHAEKYSKYLNRCRTVCIVGGVPYPKQRKQLSRPHEILIATPGRLIDFMDQGKVDFSRLEMLVLDEADRMLDMGFLVPVKQIVSATPSERQMLLFSATLKGEVVKLSKQLLKNPFEISVHSEHEKHENIDQKLHYVDDQNHKNRLLCHILSDELVKHVIIFTSTKRNADKLVLKLHGTGHRAAALHGNMNQRQRSRTISQMKDGKLRVLVATDVAARGIDLQSISHVINFDLPRSAEDYVHRIGRTGRAGARGTALSFAAAQDVSLVRKIERFTGQQIDIAEIAGLEPHKKRGSIERPGGRGHFRKKFSKKGSRIQSRKRSR